MRRPAATVLAAAVLLAWTAACGGGDDDGGGLPDVEGDGAPTAYRVVYEVTTPEGRGQEEHVVQRPFRSTVVERGADGEVLSRRTASLGYLATERDGANVAVETAIAPAAGDLRLDRFADRLVDAGRLERGGAGEVGGRPCRRLVEPDAVATDRSGGGQGDGRFPVRITRCVDAVGIVLEERITTPGGQDVRTRRAVELELGDDVPEVEVPELDPLPVEQGGGVVDRVDDAAVDPVAVAWAIRPPDGFERVGRFAVRPSTLGIGTTTPAEVALVTDVWRRGPDLLLVDQGRAVGATPFDPDTEVEQLQLEGIGAPAALAVDLRLAEVRLTGADGGFVRVAGTLPLDELLAVARTLAPTG